MSKASSPFSYQKTQGSRREADVGTGTESLQACLPNKAQRKNNFTLCIQAK